MDRVRRVVVVGAGVAGLACALAVARAGVEVEVVDARADAGDAAGHVDVVPNLLRELETLGLAAACLREGFVYSRMRVADAAGRPLFELPLHRLAGSRLPPALGLSHAAFMRIVADAAVARGARLRWGCAATGLRADGADAGVRLVDARDGRDVRADLVVLACGASSPLRAQAFPEAPEPRRLDQRWLCTLVQRPPQLDQPTWLVGAAGAKLLWVPVASTRAGLALLSRGAAAPRNALSALRQGLAAFPAVEPAMVAALSSQPASAVVERAVVESELLRWHRGRVLAVGEAAHAVAPHFGQPAALAFEDARVLGELLAQDLGLAELLARFENRRKPRADEVRRIVGRAARWELQPTAETDLGELAAQLHRLVSTPA